MRSVLTRLYDMLVREPQLICKYYKFRKRVASNGCQDCMTKLMVFKADGRFPHGGMFDRLKGAISVFAASQCIKRDFRISFTHPFDLRKYLTPNEYDWQIDESELQQTWPKAQPVFMYGEYDNPVRLIKEGSCERHFYYGYNSLDWLNKRYNKSFEFGNLYNKLFKPTEYLQKYIDYYIADIGNPYIAVHFRFMNLIGDCTEFVEINPTLSKEKQDTLIEKSLEQLSIINCQLSVGHRLLLATDSTRFTEIVRQRMPNVYIIPGEIKHIGTASDNSDDSNIKMFLDYYLIAGAQKVYNLVSEGMWKSAFPEYAAKIGGASFERIFY